MPEILLSIIMPVYNVEKYIEKSIKSVIEQTSPNWELIIVDDGSKDNSIKVAQSIVKDISNIRIVIKENGGLSDARNFGLQYTNGSHIMFLDSDDDVSEHLVADIIDSITENSPDIILFGFTKVFEDKDGNVLSKCDDLPRQGFYTKTNFSTIPISRNFLGLMGYAWNKIYKKDLIIKNNLIFEKGTALVEDILFNEIAFKYTKSIQILEKSYLNYIQRPRETLGTKFYDKHYELKIRALKARINICSYWGSNKEVYMNLLYESLVDTTYNTVKILESSNFLTKLEKKEKRKTIKNDFKELEKCFNGLSLSMKRKVKKILLYLYTF